MNIRIVEVGPRDGFQSFPRIIDTKTKVEIIDRLSNTGITEIEFTGFVHPKVIPNLADAEDIFRRIRKNPQVSYRALVPNEKGAIRAATVGVKSIVSLMTVSELYSRKNQNMTVVQSFDQAARSFEIAQTFEMEYALGLGMAIWCPYEGKISVSRAAKWVEKAHGIGIRKIALAGSLGMETPVEVRDLFGTIKKSWPDIRLGYHVHNMAGMAPLNILAAIESGAESLEGSICGLGGGIATPVAAGNFPTEDLVRILNEAGYDTDINAAEVIAASRGIAKLLNIEPKSHSAIFGLRDEVLKP